MTNMRQLYETACHQEQGRNLAPPQSSGSSGVPGADPFYDRYPWFRLIGRSVLQYSTVHNNLHLVYTLFLSDCSIRVFRSAILLTLKPTENFTKMRVYTIWARIATLGGIT